MKKIIVTTTINPPTAEIRKYDAMKDWSLIVVGDKKTPEYKLERGRFIPWQEVESLYPFLVNLIGWNCTQLGRMVAFLEAAKEKPDIVATIDDDCDPQPEWPGHIHLGSLQAWPCGLTNGKVAFDPVRHCYGIPARGFPPQLSREGCYYRFTPSNICPLVQQVMWNGEPDVDAVSRLHRSDGAFSCPVDEPFWGDAPFSPINTQNTLIQGSFLKYHCGEIPFVGHASDIWAGYLFQAVMPHSTIYSPAVVRHWQNRSYESILKDLEEELYSYRYTLDFLHGLEDHGPDKLDLIPCVPYDAIKAIDFYRGQF